MLDVLWGVASYERMVVDWQMDPAEATRGISWVIELIRQAIVASLAGFPNFRALCTESGRPSPRCSRSVDPV